MLTSKYSKLIFLALLASGALAHHDNEQEHFEQGDGTVKEQWTQKYGAQIDLSFSGPLSYAHVPYTKCLDDSTVSVPTNIPFSIRIIMRLKD
jgi:agmatinase